MCSVHVAGVMGLSRVRSRKYGTPQRMTFTRMRRGRYSGNEPEARTHAHNWGYSLGEPQGPGVMMSCLPLYHVQLHLRAYQLRVVEASLRASRGLPGNE